jgi:hypothetical protein
LGKKSKLGKEGNLLNINIKNPFIKKYFSVLITKAHNSFPNNTGPNVILWGIFMAFPPPWKKSWQPPWATLGFWRQSSPSARLTRRHAVGKGGPDASSRPV